MLAAVAQSQQRMPRRAAVPSEADLVYNAWFDGYHCVSAGIRPVSPTRGSLKNALRSISEGVRSSIPAWRSESSDATTEESLVHIYLSFDNLSWAFYKLSRSWARQKSHAILRRTQHIS